MKHFIVFFCALVSIAGQDRVILTTVEVHPWQVSLEHYGTHHCGGALISLEWLVTSASCLAKVGAKLIVRAGSTYLGQGGQTRRLVYAQIPVALGYKIGMLDHDIAVVRVDSPFSNELVSPVSLPLPSDGDLFEGPVKYSIPTTGWLFKEANDLTHGQLVEIRPPLVPLSDCKRIFFGTKTITSNMFCAGYEKNLCREDLGNPAVVAGILLGILVSGCDPNPSHPAIYTSVPAHVNWIRNVTGVVN